MARNLSKQHTGPLYVYDVNAAAVEKFIEAVPQAVALTSAGDIAEKAATVITMLPEPAHVEGVYKSMLDAVDKDSLMIDSSTIGPETARRVAAEMARKNATAFDAPVSGGTIGANNGTLTFMVGGPSEAAFQKIKPTLSTMGKNVVYCGASGTGQVAKICNNMMLAISMIGVSEALLLGTRLGMDPALLAGIMNTSTGRCWASDTCNPHPGVCPNAPAGNGYQGGFANKLIAKDLRLAMKAASEVNNTPTLGAISAEVYNELAKTDYASLDFSSVYKYMDVEQPTKKKVAA
ncbi:hypothetical protein EC973_001507 [Apophysomyces ossiformis]|uniref:3-hydroxyisobutyrate dehydrogenase n=1 Tax=Apophysomyces ossiformis TaxID=679940 RepID=A0A8H7BHT6_9FUNG|nr:hypothetical protein EC973_001507 [Apophysomyces ossiformis]